MIKRFFALAVLLFVAVSCFAGTVPVKVNAEEQNNSENVWEETAMSITGTDDFGRTIGEENGMRKDRYVGLFYFIWFDFVNSSYKLDVTKLLRTYPDALWDPYDKTGRATPGAMFYFNEPLYGYYKSTDEWVVRKHIEMFIAAGLDFIALDLSNDVIYPEALILFANTLLEYQNAGWNVPKLVCYTNLNTGHTVDLLYKALYKNDKYKSLWFYGPYDKPLIVAHREELSQEYRDFFHVRPAQWPGFEYEQYEDGIPYCDLNKPPLTHENLIGISVGQHNSYIFSNGLRIDPKYPGRDAINYGRGYTTKSGKNGDPEAIMRGDNIQEQWDYAISQDPEIIFVTGWNEWATNKRLPEEGQTVAWFVDTFNTEFSRDIEMTKERRYEKDPETGEYISEGYADNFYLQMIQNIRKYKGINEDTGAEKFSAEYRNIAIYNEERNCGGYKQAKADNFVRTVDVKSDCENVTFTIKTAEDITAHTEGRTNWMNLFIGVRGQNGPSWETYQYVLNRNPGTGTTSLEKYDGKTFSAYETADMTVSGNEMNISIPLGKIGIESCDFTLVFKVADSIEKENDIMDYYVSGSSVPLGRLSYTFRSGKGSALENNTENGSKQTKSGLSLKNALKYIIPVTAVCLLAIAGVLVYAIKKSKKSS